MTAYRVLNGHELVALQSPYAHVRTWPTWSGVEAAVQRERERRAENRTAVARHERKLGGRWGGSPMGTP
jgi:hypothetical protein